MAAGLRIRGTSGAIQIDQNYSNYALVASGTRAVATNASTSLGTTTVTLTGVAPIIAWSGAGWVCHTKTVRSGSSWTFTLMAYGAGSVALTYYVFDQTPTISTGRAGFRIRRPSDKLLIFDSSMKYARPVAEVATSAGTAGEVTTNLTAGRSYAVTNLNNPVATSINVVPGPPTSGGTPSPAQIYQTVVAMMARGIAGAIQTRSTQIASAQTNSNQWTSLPPAGSYNWAGSVLALDMTNY